MVWDQCIVEEQRERHSTFQKANYMIEVYDKELILPFFSTLRQSLRMSVFRHIKTQLLLASFFWGLGILTPKNSFWGFQNAFPVFPVWRCWLQDLPSLWWRQSSLPNCPSCADRSAKSFPQNPQVSHRNDIEATTSKAWNIQTPKHPLNWHKKKKTACQQPGACP